jgi:hypothetical protein
MDRTFRPTQGAPDDIRERSKRQHSTPAGFPGWETKPVHKSRSALPVAIVHGIVILIGRRGHVLVRHNRALINIKWYKHVLPPKVKIGSTVTVMGKMMTFNNGRTFQLLDSVLLKLPPVRAAKVLSDVLSPFIVDPESYLPKYADGVEGRAAKGSAPRSADTH